MDLVALPFSELQNLEIHQLYLLRAKVFVVEQNCPYLDVDDYDLLSHHVLVREMGKLAAYCRIIPPGKKYAEASIGRVVVDPGFRGKQYGRDLMNFSMLECRKLYPAHDIVISAQSYLLDFYISLGFVIEGEPYDEDDIPHRQMRLSN